MKSIGHKIRKQLFLFTADTFLFFSTLFIVLSFRHLKIIDYDYFIGHVYSFLPIYIFLIISLFVADLYNVFDIIRKSIKIRRIFYCIFASLLFGITYFYFFTDDFSPKTILIAHLTILFVIISINRIYFTRIQFTKNKIKTMIIADKKEGFELMSAFSRSEYSIEITLHISSLSLIDKNKQEVKDIVKNYVKLHNIKLIILDTKDPILDKILQNIIFDNDFEGVGIVDMFDLYEYVFRKVSPSSLNYKSLLYNAEFSPDKKIYYICKRILEIIITIPVLCVWAILHPFVYFNLKREIANGQGENSIFMIRTRMGKRGKKIKILKYRTMLYSDAGDKWLGETGNVNKVTPFGEFLRKTRIDELPQILSVIKGDLALVGPRQDEVGLYEKLRDEIENYDFRYIVTPGLSGWAQTTMNIQPKSIEESKERFSYDMYYVKHQSIFLDIIIILRTIKTILSREG